MDAFGTAPMVYGRAWPRVDDSSRDLVVKVKYGDTLKRFNARVNGSHFDHDLPALRLKIASAFKFSPDAEFILTYTDEDGDVVMLDDDNDLRDAAINQKLNPLRINVQLKSRNVLATQAKQQATNSKSPTSVSLEGQLAQVKSAIDEALKFVPEQVPAILAKLSHDLRFRAASSTPSLAELLDRCGKLITRSSNIYRCAKLITRSSNLHPSCGFADSSQKLGSAKVKLESALVTGSASETSNGQNSGISETGLRGEDPNAKIEQAPPCPSVRDSLVFTSSGGMKGDHKSIDSEIKFTSDACSKGKSVLSSWPLVSTIDMQPLFPSPPVYEPTPFFTPFNPISGANGKTTGDLHSTFPPPLNIYSPIKLNTPSSVGMCCPNLYSNGSSHGDRTGSLSSYVPNTEGINSFGSSYRGLGANYRGTPLPYAQHRRIQCDGCGVTPIVGPRYKSNVKEDYDLCDACFSHIGNEVEYTRLDSPASKSNMKLPGKVPAIKTDSRFIKDVTVPDGTPMAPSTPFTKIWRMRNNGFSKWPYGTQLLWVGGDRLTRLSPFRLAISANGGLDPCQETDVTVDFLAPSKPGRYISYWRLALPSGLTFGQQIWVHIEVEQPSGSKQAAAINLNQLPEANTTKPFLFNINSAQAFLSGWRGRLQCETVEPKEPEPVPSDMSSAPAAAAVEPVQIPVTDAPASSAEAAPAAVELVRIPVTDAPASSAEAALDSMPAAVPAPEAILVPRPVSVPAPVSASAPAPVAAPVSMPVVAAVPAEVNHLLEEKMMSELEVLGFMQTDLNKQILRQNNYDLEQSVVVLCGFNEWDPLDGFSELGSDDTVMSEEVVVDNSDDEGFIVADLIIKATKKDQ